MTEMSIQINIFVDKFQTKKFKMNIHVNATKSQNENDFVFEYNFVKNI